MSVALEITLVDRRSIARTRMLLESSDGCIVRMVGD